MVTETDLSAAYKTPAYARATLEGGFTTVRDVGGSTDLVAAGATMGKRPQPAMRVPRSFPRGSQARLESAGRDSCSPWMPEADGGSSALSELVQGGRRGSDL